MKNLHIYLMTLMFIAFSCNDLDLNPLSEGSSQSWYSNKTEIEMSVNDLFRSVFWAQDGDDWTDDWTYRESLTPINNGTINGEWGVLNDLWTLSYKNISRSNTILLNLDKVEGVIPQETVDKFRGNALFVRAAQYANLVAKFGDVIYFTGILDLEESFTLSRTDKEVVMEAVYEDFDMAASLLPESYGNSENKFATKGAAYAMKARAALYNGDFAIARDAAKACMDLGVYELYPDYGELFWSENKNTVESIFSMPRSTALNSFFGDCKNYITRNNGGWAAKDPSWELLSAYLCTDGLPIDESPLYDPSDPFSNRDPRLAETIVPFNTPHLGFIYQPHPDSLEVLNLNTGAYQKNNDTRSNAAFASFNGLVWKKGINSDWTDDFRAENEIIIMRYADVLLMYAEAKIELDDIDQSVLDAINMVRARAYEVDYMDTGLYPAVVTTDQSELRKEVRLERRVELAFEGRRYMDIIRWRLAEKVLNKDVYGMLDLGDLRTRIIDEGLWFFPQVTDIDEDGIANFDPMYQSGLIRRLAQREFDPERQYLWPIPSKEVLINDNLSQNPNY